MKKFFFAMLISICSTVSFAQEKIIYDANAEVRTIGSFNSIKVSHGIELLLKQGNEEGVAVSANEIKYRDAIKTEVVNGELRIYVEQSFNKWWKQLNLKEKYLKAYVSFKTLEKIDGSSGSKITIDGNLNSAILDVDLSSGATLKGNIKAMNLTIDQSSGGRSDISGDVENLNVTASSGGHFYGYDLVVDKCKADASSGGKMQINVTKEIVAYASSGGGIDYKGEAVIMDVSTSSGGKIKRNK